MKNSSAKYDAAIYITRYFILSLNIVWIVKIIKFFIVRALIYSNDKPAVKLEGLSNEKAMCRRDACLILEDSFISTGWVAAHELGHS